MCMICVLDMFAVGSRNSSRRVAPTEKQVTQYSVFEEARETVLEMSTEHIVQKERVKV